MWKDGDKRWGLTCGDLPGIAGKTLPEIEGLEMKAFEEHTCAAEPSAFQDAWIAQRRQVQYGMFLEVFHDHSNKG